MSADRLAGRACPGCGRDLGHAGTPCYSFRVLGRLWAYCQGLGHDVRLDVAPRQAHAEVASRAAGQTDALDLMKDAFGTAALL